MKKGDDKMDFNPLKYVAKIMWMAVSLFVFGTFFTLTCNKDVAKSIKQFIPDDFGIKPKESIDSNVKTTYEVDDKEVTAEEYFEWVNKQVKAGKWGKGEMKSEDLRIDSDTEIDKLQYETR